VCRQGRSGDKEEGNRPPGQGVRPVKVLLNSFHLHLLFVYRTGLEINHKSLDIVKKSQVGAGVAVKIEHAVYESARLFGRHFDEKDEIISYITRESIDTLKAHFKADVAKDEWQLIIKQKAILGEYVMLSSL